MEARALAQNPFLTAVAGVFAATACGFVAVGAVLPVLPRYVKGPVGGTDVEVGLVIGAFAFAAILTRPWAGRLADTKGRQPIMVAGSLVMALAGLLLFAPASVPVLVLTRLLLGAGEGFVFTAASTWVIDLAPVERRGQSIGLFGLSVWGGLSVGPLIGEGLYTAGGFHAVWALAVAGPLAGAIVAARLPAAPPPYDEQATRGALIPRETVGPGLALALANIGYATLAAFVGLHLAARGAGSGAPVFTAFAVAVVATRLLAGRAPDRFGARPAAIAAGCAEAAGLALIAAAGAWWMAVAGAVVMGSGFALLYPSLAVVVVDRIPEARRGAALGAFTAFFDAGMGIGGPLAGAIAAVGGYPAAFWAASGAAAGAACIAARVRVSPSRA